MFRKLTYITVAFVLGLSLDASAQTPWLHVYRNSHNFYSTALDSVQSIEHSVEIVDEPVMRIKGNSDIAEIPLSDVDYYEIGANVPTIYIDIIDHPEMQELVDKETYLDAMITVDGMGVKPDLAPTKVSIKGRGNSTWNYPKKPYRLKFPKKTEILGLNKGKSYALIANYIDCSQMRNAVAFETARLLGMPFTNHVQPVRVYFNGILKGAYFITEKVGISSNSVDIDENTGILFELDKNFDEDYRFRSPLYDLPVMVKDPDFTEIAEKQGTTPDELLAKWQADFNDFESKVYNRQLVDGVDYDMASLVDFLIVYNLCGNRELEWPKSVYLHKTTIEGPYVFGPVWDFDWAFTYNNGVDDKEPDVQLLPPWGPLLGQPFFKKLCSTSAFRKAYKQRWEYFCENLLPQLYQYMEEYAATIIPSAKENGLLWPTKPGTCTDSFDIEMHIATLRQWIEARVAYISNHRYYGLYE